MLCTVHVSDVHVDYSSRYVMSRDLSVIGLVVCNACMLNLKQVASQTLRISMH